VVVLSVLRQPRYAALSALMLLVAILCVGFGTWQIARLEQKRTDNGELRRNYHQAAAPVTDVLPLVGHGKAPGTHKIQYRTVTATGNYDVAGQALVRQASVGDQTGYLVLTPLTTDQGTLLVVRGFLATTSNTVQQPAAPSGTVTVTARVEPADVRNDQAQELGNGQVESINPGDQAGRLGRPVFDAYAELLNGPGGSGLTAMPPPDLSNPDGGAIEPQHLAYIIQWYLFAGLAVAAPYFMARADARHDTSTEGTGEFGDEPAPLAPEDARSARLADRYDRPRR
jgi:cytochrome oxidase assembly protein ShyY1